MSAPAEGVDLHRGRLEASQAATSQADVLDHLLWRTLSRDDELRLRFLGLQPGAPYAVFVARLDAPSRALGQTLDAISKRLALAGFPGLLAIRHEEVVGVTPLRAAGTVELAGLLRHFTARRAQPVDFRAGVSSSSFELAETAGRYSDALLALGCARDDRAVVAFDDLAVVDYLVQAGALEASRLVAAGVRRLLADDRQDVWLRTLHVYADCDLSVAGAAARLGVHPNTVRYRLRTIERLTAQPVSTFHGLCEVFAQIAVARGRRPFAQSKFPFVGGRSGTIG